MRTIITHCGRVLLLLLLAALFGMGTRSAAAHGFLVRAVPEDRAVLQRAPARVQYYFSEELEPEFSRLIVRDEAGRTVAEGGVPPENRTMLQARLPVGLPDGAYVNELRVAFASDGHVIVETRTFFVGVEARAGIGGASGGEVVLLEVVWRFGLLFSLTLLLGIYALYTLVLYPAWGSREHPVGGLPPRVIRLLDRIAFAALIGAAGANIIALFQQTMVFFGTDAGRVIADGLWNVVRVGTRFGDTWNARMVLLALVAMVHGAGIALRRTMPEATRGAYTANGWGAVLLFGTMSVAGHAAGALSLPWLALMSDWLHGAAVGIWAGGAAVLGLLLPVALAPYRGETRRAVLLPALRRFSGVAAACLGIVLATGLYNAANWVQTPSQLGTGYGIGLLAKGALAAALIAVGAAHHIALRPERYARWSARLTRLGDFVPSLRLEMVFVVLTLGGAALLGATPPPQPDLVRDNLSLTASADLGELEVTATVSPGGVGVNTIDVLLTANGNPVQGDDLNRVRIRAAQPERDWRSSWLALDPAGDGLYVGAGGEFERAGAWWLIIEIERGTTIRRAVFPVTIREEAALNQARPPSVVQLVLLGLVMGAVVIALMPAARRVVSKLELNPAVVTIALGSAVATALIVAVGLYLGERAAVEYDLVVNPPPRVVNLVMLDEESLARGRERMAAACGWESAPDWVELLRRLPRLRDEELYAAVSDGWRALPACGASLSDTERWDIVNFVRSYER